MPEVRTSLNWFDTFIIMLFSVDGVADGDKQQYWSRKESGRRYAMFCGDIFISGYSGYVINLTQRFVGYLYFFFILLTGIYLSMTRFSKISVNYYVYRSCYDIMHQQCIIFLRKKNPLTLQLIKSQNCIIDTQIYTSLILIMFVIIINSSSIIIIIVSCQYMDYDTFVIISITIIIK